MAVCACPCFQVSALCGFGIAGKTLLRCTEFPNIPLPMRSSIQASSGSPTKLSSFSNAYTLYRVHTQLQLQIGGPVDLRMQNNGDSFLKLTPTKLSFRFGVQEASLESPWKADVERALDSPGCTPPALSKVDDARDLILCPPTPLRFCHCFRRRACSLSALVHRNLQPTVSSLPSPACMISGSFSSMERAHSVWTLPSEPSWPSAQNVVERI